MLEVAAHPRPDGLAASAAKRKLTLDEDAQWWDVWSPGAGRDECLQTSCCDSQLAKAAVVVEQKVLVGDAARGPKLVGDQEVQLGGREPGAEVAADPDEVDLVDS